MIMAESVEMVRKVADAPAMAAKKRFRGYKPEAEKATRKPNVERNEALMRMMEVWDRIIFSSNEAPEIYDNILHSMPEMDYTAEDVHEFCLRVGALMHEDDFPVKAGPFISALINTGKDSSYVVDTRRLGILIDNLGFENKKEISVIGDVGDYLGNYMEVGSITIEGDAGKGVGCGLRGGNIVVQGNAGILVGMWMRDGEILVKGDAGTGIGENMIGGTITIMGDCGKVGYLMRGGVIRLEGTEHQLSREIEGGSIFYKGKRLI
jgi:formylmethanofuran dehydrogenase subunit C